MRWNACGEAILVGICAVMLACGGKTEAPEGGGGAASGRVADAAGDRPTGRAARASAQIKSCDLLSETEAEALLGVALKTPQPAPGGGNRCMYEPEQPGGTGMILSIEGYFSSPDEFHDQLRKSAEDFDMKTEPVEGLGDAALWAEDALWVLKDRRAFVVGSVKDLPTARAVAEKVLPRI
jgi:hypothetical protein